MVNYLLADLVNRVKFASLLKFSEVVILNNKLSYFILIVLSDLGYISMFCIINFKFLKIYLIYKYSKLNIRQLYIVSRPSSRIYFSIKNIKGTQRNNYHNTSIFTVYSTSSGVLTELECTLLKTGGEPVLEIN